MYQHKNILKFNVVRIVIWEHYINKPNHLSLNITLLDSFNKVDRLHYMIHNNVLGSDNNVDSFSLNHLTHPDNSKRSKL